MARKLDDVMAALPKDRQKRVEARAMELATLKDLVSIESGSRDLEGLDKVATLVASQPGTDTVTCKVTVAGVDYTATDAVTINPLPQTLGSIKLIATVS